MGWVMFILIIIVVLAVIDQAAREAEQEQLADIDAIYEAIDKMPKKYKGMARDSFFNANRKRPFR